MGDNNAVVADGTVRISAMAFAGSDVRQVVLPYTVAAIGHKAFYECNSLQFVSFSSYEAPILEEEYDSYYYESMEHIPAVGDYDFVDYYNNPIIYEGLGITPYFMWNVTSLPSNFFYGANFVDYVGHVENKITMIRPTNGKYYDSFILNQYFDLTVNGASAADDITLAAIEAIKQLPTDAKKITLAQKAIVEAARAAYDKIVSFEQRALVPGDVLAILTTAEQRIADLEFLQNSGTGTDDTVDDSKNNTFLILNIIIGIIFILVVIAFIAVLVVFILILKKGGFDLIMPEKKEKESETKKVIHPYGYEPVEQIVHKAKPVEKLKKGAFVSIEALIEKHKADGNKPSIAVIVAIALAAVVVIGGIIWAVVGGNDSFYSDYNKDGFSVRVTFDSNGGTFKGSDSSVIDLYKADNIGEDGIKLLAPDDTRRDKNNALTVTKAGYFLAGWYTERTLIDENNPELGYTYSGKWDFENDRLVINSDEDYSAEESALTLYAAWVPYYNFEIYAKDADGNMVIVANASAINLTIPEWAEGDVTLNLDNFPAREGYTLSGVYYDEAMTEKVVGTPNEAGNKNYISGQWDEASATSLTPTIKLYTTWQDGERYRIYTTDDLKKNADPNGYYEIYADLDFTGTEWPSAFSNGKFNGKIFGNNHKITGVSFESNSRSRIANGMFSALGENAYIENLKLENITHTINLMSVASGASFGLLAGTADNGATFKNVQIGGKILIGDNCASLAGGTDYVISKVIGNGTVSGVTDSITVEKVNPGNNAFGIKVEDDGTVSITTGSN